ncbi:MAG: hypothetical protein WBW04_09050 [Nitrolancea sp.]
MARAFAIQTSEIGVAHMGCAITRDILDSDGQVIVPKGTLIDQSTLDRLAHAAPTEAHVLEFEKGELHEDEAGRRVATTITGRGLRIADPTQSRFDLIAEQKGLLRVDRVLLDQINRVLGVTVYTTIEWQPVVPGTVVASVKITPIAVLETQIAKVERICRKSTGPLLRVQPFIPRRVGVLALDDVNAEMRQRFEASIERKLRWYGATLVELRYAPLDASAVETSLRELIDAGADLLLTGGGITIDPLDPIELALKPLGAEMVHMGAPTRGSMFWLARVGDVPIINVASCRMWTGGAVGDLILPLVMAGETVTPEMIVEIGHGGLPGSAIRLRYPTYEDSV